MSTFAWTFTRWPDLDLPVHPARLPDCWRCDVCHGFFYRPAAVTPTGCPYCIEAAEEAALTKPP